MRKKMCYGLQDVITLPKINTKAHLYDLQRLEHFITETKQIPARSLPSFVVLNKSLNSSFTCWNMRLCHFPYRFPWFLWGLKIRQMSCFYRSNLRNNVGQVRTWINTFILSIRKSTQSMDVLLQTTWFLEREPGL